MGACSCANEAAAGQIFKRKFEFDYFIKTTQPFSHAFKKSVLGKSYSTW